MELKPYEPRWRDRTAKLWFDSSAALRGGDGPWPDDLAQRLEHEIADGWEVWLGWEG